MKRKNRKGIFLAAVLLILLSLACVTQNTTTNVGGGSKGTIAKNNVSDSAKMTYCVIGFFPASYNVYIFTQNTYSHYDYTDYWLQVETGYDYFTDPAPTERSYLVFEGDMPGDVWENLKTSLQDQKFESLPKDLDVEGIYDGTIYEIEVLDDEKRDFSGGYMAGYGSGINQKRFNELRLAFGQAASLCEVEPEVEAEPQEEKPEKNVKDYYSSDGSVFIRRDFDEMKSYIIDGDRWIAVNASMEGYDPIIDKFDVDGDGIEEYLIADCEGTGTGCSLYGLIIVKAGKIGDKVVQTKYPSRTLAKMLEEAIDYRYDEKTHEITVFEKLPADTDRYEGYTTKLRQDADLKSIVFTDIINLSFKDGKVYLIAPVGCIYSDTSYPDYDNSIIIKGELYIKTEDENTKIEDIQLTIGPDEE